MRIQRCIVALALCTLAAGCSSNSSGKDTGTGKDADMATPKDGPANDAPGCNTGCQGGGASCTGQCSPACTGGKLCCAWAGGPCVPTEAGPCAANGGFNCVAASDAGVCPNQCFP